MEIWQILPEVRELGSGLLLCLLTSHDLPENRAERILENPVPLVVKVYRIDGAIARQEPMLITDRGSKISQGIVVLFSEPASPVIELLKAVDYAEITYARLGLAGRYYRGYDRRDVMMHRQIGHHGHTVFKDLKRHVGTDIDGAKLDNHSLRVKIDHVSFETCHQTRDKLSTYAAIDDVEFGTQ